MNNSILSKMRCIFCEGAFQSHAYETTASGAIQTGVIFCKECLAWFSIEDRVLELLPPTLAYTEDRNRFWQQHQTHLTSLGLSHSEQSEPQPAVKEQKIQQAHFDQYAKNERQTYYDYQNMPFWKCIDKQIFNAWRTRLKPGKLLLEIGCGQGRGLAQLSDLPLGMAAFDISKEMVKEGAARYYSENHAADVSFFVADANTLPFESGVFDYVLAYGVLHHLPNPETTCWEISRVLAKDGMYFGSENNKTGLRVFFDWLQKLVPIWHEEAGEEPLLSSEMLDGWFEKSGLKPQTTTHVFVPPHLVNLFGERWGTKLVQATDGIGSRLGFVRKHGGLITFTVQNSAA